MMQQAVTTTTDHQGGRLIAAIGRLQVHDHLCLFYETGEEQFAAIVPFLRLGLERGEKCLYIAADNTAAVVLAALEAGGIDTAAALQSGALSVLDTRETYLKEGYFDPDLMICFLGEAIAAAKAEGFTALRATGEMTRALGNEIAVERLLAYESKLNSFFPENDLVAICQFKRNGFSPEVIRDIILAHPLVINDHTVCHNFYFVPPDAERPTKEAGEEVDRMLRHLCEREVAEATLRENEQCLVQLMDTFGDGIVRGTLPDGRIEDVNQAATTLFGSVPEEMIGEPIRMLYADAAGYAASTEKLRAAIAQGRDQVQVELELRRKDGSTFWGEVNTMFFPRQGQAATVINVIRDITERKRVEEEGRAHLWFLEGMDRVNRVLQESNDLDRMMSGVLDALLAIFACDRAWLLYPADPDAASFAVPMERTRPEFPGASRLKVAVPMDPDSAAVIRTAMAAAGPVRFDLESRHPLPAEVAKRFGIQSQIVTMVTPKVDQPSLLGLHQCAYPRVWTAREERLVQEIGRRLGDGLASLLAHRELQKSENRYRRITEGLTDYQYSVRVENGRAIETVHSPACATVTGYTAEEFALDPYLWFRMVAPEDRELIQERVQHILAGEDIPPIEHRILRKDGVERWVCDTTIMQKDAAGRLLSYDGVIKDITERKHALETLREREAFIRNILDNIGIGVALISPEMEIVEMNRRMRDWFPGVKPAQHPLCYCAFNDPPREEVCHECPTQKTLRDGLVHEVTMQKPQAGGSRTYRIVSSPVLNGQGEIRAAIVLVDDITDRLGLEAQLRQAQKMESIGRLAGGVAHDFNNMLGVIIGYTELALEEMDPDQPLSLPLHEIRKAALRSADLTRQLLAFARKQTVIPQVLDLNETVEGMLKMLQRLIGEDIQLTWLPGAGIWPVKVDPSQIDQVLANLCVNARDAITGTGRITIETRAVRFDEAYCAVHPGAVPGEYVLLAVSDDGCGMDQETLGKLFEPFFTTKEMGKGTGLGLATVYGIVKQNGGFVTVASERGHGATFHIYLPRHVAAGAEGMREEGQAVPVASGHETVLLVEDEPAILDMARRMLEKLGYRVLAAPTPGEAIRRAGEHAGEVHLLLTDVIMPEMNGRDLANSLIGLHPEIRSLFMSGYTSDVIAPHSVLEEGVHFLQKPFSLQTLAAKVREALASDSRG